MTAYKRWKAMTFFRPAGCKVEIPKSAERITPPKLVTEIYVTIITKH